MGYFFASSGANKMKQNEAGKKRKRTRSLHISNGADFIEEARGPKATSGVALSTTPKFLHVSTGAGGQLVRGY